MSAGGLANSDVKPLEADIVALLVKLFLGDDVAVELWVSAELGASLPSVSHRTVHKVQVYLVSQLLYEKESLKIEVSMNSVIL